MNTDHQIRLYNDLSWLWPIISPPEDYVEKTNQIVDILNKQSKSSNKQLLHLGCGGGHNDFTFKNSFKVTGIDKSDAMLDIARNLNPENLYINNDLLQFSFPYKFGSIVVLDSVNYILKISDLRMMYKLIYKHLDAGGISVTLIEETKDDFKDKTIEYEKKSQDTLEIHCKENIYDPDTSDSSYEVAFEYNILSKGIKRVEKDLHVCGLFRKDEWLQAAQSSGFSKAYFVDYGSGKDKQLLLVLEK